jgi:hypothetical protein
MQCRRPNRCGLLTWRTALGLLLAASGVPVGVSKPGSNSRMYAEVQRGIVSNSKNLLSQRPIFCNMVWFYVHYVKTFYVTKAHWSLYVPHSGHYMYRTVVTICIAQWSLYVLYSGHYMYRSVVTICTAQRSLYIPHSGHYMYHQFNIQQFYVLPTQCIYVFCVDLRTNSDYFPIQH